MIIKQEQFIPKDTVETTIDLLIRNLTTIKDNTGEFLLDFDGLKVDDKKLDDLELAARRWVVWYI